MQRDAPLVSQDVTRAVAAVAVLLAWVTTIALNAPGHLSYDSVLQLQEGVTGVYAGFHPPVMSAVLGASFGLVRSTALYLVVAQAPLFAGLLIVILTARRIAPIGTILVVACLCTPLVQVYQGIVWKDVLFANVTALSFCALVAGTRARSGPLIVLSIASAIAASLTRQNGVIVPVATFSFLAYRADTLPLRAWLRALIAAVLAIALATGATALVGVMLVGSTGGNGLSSGIAIVLKYDIAGILARTPDVPAPLSSLFGSSASEVVQEIRAYYGADRMDWLAKAMHFQTIVGGFEPQQLREAWGALVAAHPIEFLAHKADVFRWLVLPPDLLRCLPVYVGVNGPADVMSSLGLTAGVRPSDRALYNWSAWHFGTPLYFHASYAALLVVVLAAGALLRREPAVFVMLPICALLLLASYFAIGIACDFRYAYFLPISVLVVALCASTSGPAQSTSRTREASAA